MLKNDKKKYEQPKIAFAKTDWLNNMAALTKLRLTLNLRKLNHKYKKNYNF